MSRRAGARIIETSTQDGEVMGAAQAAPSLNPLRLAQTAVAAIARLMSESVGADFSHGAVAVGALAPGLGAGPLAGASEERLLQLVPLGPDGGTAAAEELIAQLSEAGLDVVASAPRHRREEIDDALREAGILLELLADPVAALRAHEPTYRLLVGVWLRNPGELTDLRVTTITPLE
ncbi:MAG TPA: hypothetical protein VME01_05640, partial [Solirubrobacteraceae bacterium]|nr:hypothetical protein [Solirubrobacteraceae bacterium]